MTRPIPFGIVPWSDPILRQPAEPIADITVYEVELADYMAEVLRGCSSGLGVAACQVGVAASMFVYRSFNDADVVHTVVNPQLEEHEGDDFWCYREGCLSIPGVFFDIYRPKRVTLTGYDLDGGSVTIEATTLLARLFQHEIDHLEGRLILDRVNEGVRTIALERLERGRRG